MQLASALRLSGDPAHPDVIAVVGGGGKSSIVFRIALDMAQAGQRTVITHTARIAAFQTAWAPAFVETTEDYLPLAALAQALDTHGVCLLTGPVVADRRAGLLPATVDALARHAATLGIAAITVEADGSKMRPVKAPAEHEPVLPDATTLLAPVLGLDAVGAFIDTQNVHRPERVRQVLGLSALGSVRLTPAQAARLLVHPAGGAKARPASASIMPLLNKADSTLRLVYGRLVAHSLATHGQPALLTAANATDRDPVAERWGRVAVVVLAAGASRRMGRPKPLEVVDGKPMVIRAVQVAGAAGVGPVMLVTGAQAAAVLATLAAWPLAPVQIVHNPDWAAGQATSMHAALRSLPPAVGAVIFVPVDQPFLDPLLLRHLARAWRCGANLAAPTVAGVVRGAPALFDRSLFSELLAVTGDVGGRALLQRHHLEVTRIPTDPAWLKDIDSPADLA
jgi:molybdenum cofactor cytidylyltransferase